MIDGKLVHQLIKMMSSFVALALGLIGMNLGGVALSRSRSAAWPRDIYEP
jgi:hypothetical protein